MDTTSQTNKKKLLVIDGLSHEGIELLENRVDIEFEILMNPSEEDIIQHSNDVLGITVRGTKVFITEKIIENAKSLKVVSRHGVGYDNINVDSLSKNNIPLCIAVNSNKFTVAEHAMFMILSLAKDSFYNDDLTRKSDWKNRLTKLNAFDLSGKNLLIVGFGRIGKELAKRALAFDLKVFVYDPYVKNEIIEERNCTSISNINNHLSNIDIVSINCMKTNETKNMFSYNEFKKMKKTSMIINCARGGIIDEKALYQALINKEIASAGLDVFDEEPYPADGKLLKLQNIILSPHIAGVTKESISRMGVQTVENALNVIDNNYEEEVIVNYKDINIK